MSVQCGVTQSSPITRLANSYRPTEHVPRYYDLSGSSQWNSNNATYSNNNTVTSPNNYYSNTRYVSFSDTERLISSAAKNQVARNPENTIFDGKKSLRMKKPSNI
eukprot:456318_1